MRVRIAHTVEQRRVLLASHAPGVVQNEKGSLRLATQRAL
jgi:hypothetical protein